MEVEKTADVLLEGLMKQCEEYFAARKENKPLGELIKKIVICGLAAEVVAAYGAVFQKINTPANLG